MTGKAGKASGLGTALMDISEARETMELAGKGLAVGAPVASWRGLGSSPPGLLPSAARGPGTLSTMATGTLNGTVMIVTGSLGQYYFVDIYSFC